MLLVNIIKEDSEQFKNIYNDTHNNNCDSSCYLCMQDYANLHYHGLLNWRLGFDMVDIMKNDKFIPSLKQKRWKSLAEKSLENLMSFIKITINNNEILSIDKENLCIKSSNGRIYKLIHPLSNNTSTSQICYINILDVIKRPNEVQEKLDHEYNEHNSKIIKIVKKEEEDNNKSNITKKRRSGTKVEITNKGIKLSNTFEAFEQLIKETPDLNEKRLYEQLSNKTKNKKCDIPIKTPTIKIKNKEFNPVLVWENCKVALFDNMDSYEEAENTNAAFELYCTESDDFDIDDFISEISEE